MPETRDPAAPGRLLLAVSSAWTGNGVRRILATLVEGQDLAVDALFVEDLDLLHLAALPFTREVGRTSGISRAILTDDVERALQSAARQMERDLRRLAVEHRFVCTFETRRGRFDAEVRRKAPAVDVVLVPPRRAPASPATSAPHVPPQVIVRIETETPAGERALRLAAALARSDRSRLVVVVPDPSRQATATALGWVRARLPSAAMPVRVVIESDANPAPLAALAGAGRHDVVVLPSAGASPQDGSLDAALDTLPCTAVLVR
ncbi:MAG: hypothetical protein U1F52_21000 [Burkholderiales bacterium]